MRRIWNEENVHPSVREKIANNHSDIVDEVAAAIESNDVVVVGMAQNPHPPKARKLLKQQGIDFKYLQYGSYVSEWRRRNALKMWTGWPTFPMIWVKGTFVGGASDLQRLQESGELKEMLS